MNEKETFISIIVPLYNKERYINRCVDSVFNQSYANFELLIINDASTDNSLQKVKEIKDERVKIINRKERGHGGYAARNMGIKKAKYDYIAFLDADDEWMPEHLFEISKLIKQYPKINIFSSGWHLKSGNILKFDSYTLRLSHGSAHKVNCFYDEVVKGNTPLYTSVAVIHKKLFNLAGNFPEGKCKKGGDVEFWMRCMLHSEIAHSGKVTAIYYKDISDAVTKTISDFEIPYVVKSVKLIVDKVDAQTAIKIKKYANTYAKIAILRSIIYGQNVKQMLKSYFKEVDKKYYYFLGFLKIFPSSLLRPLYAGYRYFIVKFSKSDLG